MANAIQNRKFALDRLGELVSPEIAAKLMQMPKRVLAEALIEAVATQNGSDCDDYRATGDAALQLCRKAV